MKSDEEIEQESAALEPLIGLTRAGWYAEACDVYPEKDGHAPTLWACRTRELCRDFGRVVEAVLFAKQDGHVFGSRPCATCSRISAAILEPYGCCLYLQQRGNHVRNETS